MILLLPQLAEFLRSHNCTPLEALKWLGQFIAENNDLSQDDVKVYINYIEMAACTKKTAGTESLMALDGQPNLDQSTWFEDWSEKQLERSFGKRSQPTPPVTTPLNQAPAGQPPAEWANKMNDLVASQQVMVDAVTTLATTSGTSGKSKPTKVSERKQWYLVGLCQGTSKAHIPKVWVEMYQSATYEDALTVFEDALVA